MRRAVSGVRIPVWNLSSRYPQILLAFKAALAVAVAWLVVQPLPGVADKYPYYAPLGAVIAVSGTVAGSMRDAAQAIGAILLGAPIAWLVALVFPHDVVTLAAAVALATLASRLSWLGDKAGWAPVAALFVMLVGGTAPDGYLVAYLGLTSLGASIGLVVDLLFPALPLSASKSVVTSLRETLADQLDDVAEGLLHEQPLTADEWAKRARDIDSLATEMRQMTQHTAEARRGNWRALRWKKEADRQLRQAQAMQALTIQIRDTTNLVMRQERAELERVALGPRVRPHAAHTLQEMADTLRSVDGSVAEAEPVRRTDESVRRLVDAIREARDESGDDMFEAGELVMNLRRALTSLTPNELRDDVLSRHPT